MEQWKNLLLLQIHHKQDFFQFGKHQRKTVFWAASLPLCANASIPSNTSHQQAGSREEAETHRPPQPIPLEG